MSRTLLILGGAAVGYYVLFREGGLAVATDPAPPLTDASGTPLGADGLPVQEGAPPLEGAPNAAGGLAAPSEVARINPSCFAASRRRMYNVYPDLKHGSLYQPRAQEADEARASGMTVQQLRLVANVDAGKVWSYTWGPVWGGLSDHVRRVWARVRPGNESYGRQDWNGKPAVVIKMNKGLRGNFLKTTEHFIRAGQVGETGLLHAYKLVPRLDLPTTVQPVMDKYYNSSRWVTSGAMPRTPGLDMWRVGSRVRNGAGTKARPGYECNGVVWVPGSATVNWNKIRDRRANVEYLYSQHGMIAVRRDIANPARVVLEKVRLLHPVWVGDTVPWMGRIRGTQATSRRDAPNTWWGDSLAGVTMLAWQTLPKLEAA